MNKRTKSRNSQKGLSSIGWVAVAGLFALIMVSFVKVFPMYMEFLAVQSVLESIQKDPKIDPKSKKAIWESMKKKLFINEVYTVQRENVTMSRKDGQTTITVTYETRKPYLANLFIGANFTETVVIDR